MKKFFCALLTIILCFSLASAALAAPVVEARQITKTDFADGSYVIREVLEFASQSRSSSKSGEAIETYYTGDNTAIFSVKVTGTFTYDGRFASATDAVSTVYIHSSSASYVRKSAYTTASTAYASGTVKYDGSNQTLTVSLTCSPTGVLS